VKEDGVHERHLERPRASAPVDAPGFAAIQPSIAPGLRLRYGSPVPDYNQKPSRLRRSGRPTVSLAEARAAASIFDPQRLRVARQLRKLSRRELAVEVGVTPTAVGQWEAGDIRPRAQTLLDISRALNFPVAYFATSGRTLSNLDTDCTFFRSLRKSRQVDRDAAMAHAALIAELVTVIERHALLPSLSIPEYQLDADASNEDIDAIAARVRDNWELEDEPIEHMVRELERHGAVAARLELAKDVDAFSWPGIERPIVILGSDKDDKARSRFDAAHELGHMVVHRDHPKPADRHLERQAHRFASALLLPTHQLEAEWPAGRLNWRELMTLKRRWQMSLAALLYRAREDGLLSQTSYESAIKYMSRAGWRRREPGDLGPPERPRLLHRAVLALRETGVTLEDLADEAHFPVEIIRNYIQLPGADSRVAVEL
jgi:Zn-dependent peptidase ImmA (M78 family)/DNA-binding XRE family transcriptional regulator